jgi:hypothetical protein
VAYIIAEPCIGTKVLPVWICVRWIVFIREGSNL